MTTECLDLSIAEELAAAVKRGGGTMALAGENVELFLPDGVAHLLPELKLHKVELVVLLHRLGGRASCFPACPRCHSFALYPKDKGDFECLTCESGAEITETAARLAGFLAESKSPWRVM